MLLVTSSHHTKEQNERETDTPKRKSEEAHTSDPQSMILRLEWLRDI
jgi:hypothetical protein